eukprot:scaffold539_cov187-Ochromonas_danica.AAC.16
MSVWQLPGDILHCVYSEWLKWKDLPSMDVACMGKSDREMWLTSVIDLRMTQKPFRGWQPLNRNMEIFYKWLGNRRIFCVEGFPISLEVLTDLVVCLDLRSYFPTIRSIDIKGSCRTHNDDSHLESNLALFFSHCHSLQSVEVEKLDDTIDKYGKRFSALLLTLTNQLRENSLVEVSI